MCRLEYKTIMAVDALIYVLVKTAAFFHVHVIVAKSLWFEFSFQMPI